MEDDKRRHVSAVETAITVLATLQRRDVAGVSELATTLDMSKANVHKHLTTLHDHGFLTRDGQKYRLGLRFFDLGATARRQNPLYQEAAPKIVELAEITNQTATLMIPWTDTGTYISAIDPDSGNGVGAMEGERRLLHETASGRSILACHSETRRSKLVSIADRPDSVVEHLREIDEKGVAVMGVSQSDDRQEIAAPVIDSEGEPIGAIALVVDDGSDKGAQIEQNYRQLVKKTGETLSKRMHLRHGGKGGG